MLSVRNEGKPPDTRANSPLTGTPDRASIPVHQAGQLTLLIPNIGPADRCLAVAAPKAEMEQGPATAGYHSPFLHLPTPQVPIAVGDGTRYVDAGRTTLRCHCASPVEGRNHPPEAEKSALLPRRKMRTYCHKGFVYKSLRQGPPHAPLQIRRKNGDIRCLIAPVAKLDPSRVKIETYSPADPVLITRAHMRPLKRAEKRGRGGKILLAPMTGKTAKSPANNPGTETQRSPVSSPEYIMTSWRLSTSRPSSMAIIMSSASAIILA